MTPPTNLKSPLEPGPERPRPSAAETHPLSRPDLLGAARTRLSPIERLTLRWVRASFEPGLLAALLPFLQRTVGQAWIYHATKRLCRVHGLERVPQLEPRALGSKVSDSSVLVVANHRSFFDLYVITARLVRAGMQKRIIFPVRASFFYNRLLGLIVNFFMSFLAMYPPLFRERKKAALNLLGIDELAWLLRRGGVFVGIHPEGTRNRGDDPYAFLPPRPGVGRLIHKARVPVVPVFINGLGNDLVRQVRSNFTGTGKPIHVVFGAPIDFSDLLAEPGSPRVYQAIAERCMAAIGQAGAEEQALHSAE